jgi:hypothetical protein
MSSSLRKIDGVQATSLPLRLPITAVSTHPIGFTITKKLETFDPTVLNATTQAKSFAFDDYSFLSTNSASSTFRSVNDWQASRYVPSKLEPTASGQVWKNTHVAVEVKENDAQDHDDCRHRPSNKRTKTSHSSTSDEDTNNMQGDHKLPYWKCSEATCGSTNAPKEYKCLSCGKYNGLGNLFQNHFVSKWQCQTCLLYNENGAHIQKCGACSKTRPVHNN